MLTTRQKTKCQLSPCDLSFLVRHVKKQCPTCARRPVSYACRVRSSGQLGWAGASRAPPWGRPLRTLHLSLARLASPPSCALPLYVGVFFFPTLFPVASLSPCRVSFARRLPLFRTRRVGGETPEHPPPGVRVWVGAFGVSLVGFCARPCVRFYLLRSTHRVRVVFGIFLCTRERLWWYLVFWQLGSMTLKTG